MSSSEQLEHQAEVTRAQIVDSLAELRERMTPGQVVEQALDYARDGRPAEFFRNLGRQVVDNPVPVALIGAGLGWLIMAGRGHHASGTGAWRVGERASEASRQAVQAAEDAKWQASAAVSGLADSASDKVTDLAGSARETADSWGSRTKSAASGLADKARDAGSQLSRGTDAIGRSAYAVGSSAAQSGRSVAGFLKDEPLVLAAIGLALGAAIGAALPSTDTEDRAMGDTSDELKRDAAAFAEAKWEKGKAVAETAAEKAMEDVKREVQQAAEEEGLMPQSDSAGEPFSDREPENQASLIPEAERNLAVDGATDLGDRDFRPGE